MPHEISRFRWLKHLVQYFALKKLTGWQLEFSVYRSRHVLPISFRNCLWWTFSVRYLVDYLHPVEGKYFAPFTTSQIFPLCLYIASSKEMSLGMNWGMSQSQLDGVTDDDTMHLFQSPCQPGRLPWLTNYKTHKRLACFQRLWLLRGSAFLVTRVNLHVHFILRLWMCRSLSLIILYILKNSAMFNARLNPMRPEEIGEKNRRFILSMLCSYH